MLLSLGILGEFLAHPGVAVGVEHAADGALVPVYGARAGGYVHPGHHTALFAHGEVGGRLVVAHQVTADVLLGAGLYHQWLPTRVVVRRDDGLATVLDAGRPTVLGTVGLRVGDADGAVRPFGRADVWLRGPVNHQIRPELVLTLGAVLGGDR